MRKEERRGKKGKREKEEKRWKRKTEVKGKRGSLVGLPRIRPPLCNFELWQDSFLLHESLIAEGSTFENFPLDLHTGLALNSCSKKNAFAI